jgi:hypothetical protein
MILYSVYKNHMIYWCICTYKYIKYIMAEVDVVPMENTMGSEFGRRWPGRLHVCRAGGEENIWAGAARDRRSILVSIGPVSRCAIKPAFRHWMETRMNCGTWEILEQNRFCQKVGINSSLGPYKTSKIYLNLDVSIN